MTALGAIEILLRHRMGLNAASIGSPSVERAVRERQTACGLDDLQRYYEHVRSSDTELQELIEAVVVPETWFFRDLGAFTALAHIAVRELQRATPQRLLRILSVPCSTGEEPYSMAMALLDAGIAPQRFRIDAVDISEKSLARARQAVYGRNSFRGSELGFRDVHFTAEERHWRLQDGVRQQVQFRQANLLSSFADAAAIYDIVFCRNLLIYFDRDTQSRAIRILERLLAPGGSLFVGPSETGPMLAHGLVSAKLPLAFAFQRQPPAAAAAPKPNRPPASPTPSAPPKLQLKPMAPVPAPPAAAVATAVAGAAPSLDEAVRLADQGRLAEATRLCDDHLRQLGPSAGTLYLLGLIRDSGGDATAAAQAYRQALYLEPTHRQALAHLALLLERQGQTAAAQPLRQRLRRLETEAGGAP